MRAGVLFVAVSFSKAGYSQDSQCGDCELRPEQLVCETRKEVVGVFGVGGAGEHCTNLTGRVPGLGRLHQNTDGHSTWNTMGCYLDRNRWRLSVGSN